MILTIVYDVLYYTYITNGMDHKFVEYIQGVPTKIYTVYPGHGSIHFFQLIFLKYFFFIRCKTIGTTFL